MPTYERVEHGQVVERSATVADHPSGFDEQMAALADDPDSPWQRAVDPRVEEADSEPAAPPAKAAAKGKPAKHTEED